MNQLSPNLEHKLPVMYGILAANFFAVWYAFSVLLWPPVSWLADGHCNMLLMFRSFFRRSLGRSSPNLVTCSMVTVVYKIGLEIWGPTPPKNWRPKNITILARFLTSSQRGGEYLRNGTSYHQSVNGVAIYRHSHCVWDSHTCLLNLVNVGPQTAKNSRLI